MHEYSYKIIMETQLGSKQGTMVYEVEKGEISGSLNILGKEEAIHGELHDDGKCKLYGRFITRMRTVEYTAEGYADSEKIDLMMHGESNCFYISGIAFPFEGNGIKKLQEAMSNGKNY